VSVVLCEQQSSEFTTDAYGVRRLFAQLIDILEASARGAQDILLDGIVD
jgi:hypothetical protein